MNFKFFLSIGSAVLLLTNLVNAEMIKTEINGISVEYFVPDMSKVSISDASSMTVKVIIDDPMPLPDNYQPILAKSLMEAEKTTSTSFVINYIPNGGMDRYGETCYTFPSAAKTVFEVAASIWAKKLESTVPIRIQACWGRFSGSTLGYSGSSSQANFTNRPIANTLYKNSLANALAGRDLDTNQYDMYITYNDNFAWYFGTDGNTPADRHDLMTVVLHEIAHGLNFSGNMRYGRYSCSGANYGCYRTYPGVWDRLIVNGSGTPLLKTTNDSQAMGSALTSNNLYFNGSKAKSAYGGKKVKIYTPSTWAPGSSYSHLDYKTFNNTSNQLMVYAISRGEAIHNPGNLTFAMFEDMGWKVEGGISGSASALPAITSYLLSSSQECIAGTTWNFTWDWSCDGSVGTAPTTYYANHTTSDGSTWSLSGNHYTETFSSGTVYTGTINSACNYMKGTMSQGGSTGCWHASLKTSSAIVGSVNKTDVAKDKFSKDGVALDLSR